MIKRRRRRNPQLENYTVLDVLMKLKGYPRNMEVVVLKGQRSLPILNIEMNYYEDTILIVVPEED